MSYKQLKIFAIGCMVFDHTVRIFPLYQIFAPLADLLWSGGYGGLADWLLDECISYIMYIGRLAAPIFVYCIAQGFAHTSNVRRYIGRVFLTAVIAQVPYTLFDLAEMRVLGVEGNWRETGLNILFTLALALCVLWAHEELKRRKMLFLSPLAVAAATWLAMELRMEGGKGYIILAWVYYITRNCPRWQRALIYIPTVLLSRRGLVLWVVESLGTPELTGALRNCLLNVLGNYFGMLVTLSDNGEKGRAGKGFQRFCFA
ncbi:TraX family protein, partial [Oscillibacter sp. CU971]|uniref:TraX family protein n=1 Tax=Oscillibacter sp. CU971 TaxID=2780102 RepID=UPI001FAF69CD